MKSKIEHMILLLFCPFSLFCNKPIYGQKKLNITTGIGFLELLNAGLRYQFDQVQMGLGVGTLPVPDEESLAVLGDIFFHVGGQSRLSVRRPWYLKLGLTYNRLKTDDEFLQYIYFSPRMGRELNLLKNFGFQMDIGKSFQIFRRRVFQTAPIFELDLNFPFLPSFGASIFIFSNNDHN